LAADSDPQLGCAEVVDVVVDVVDVGVDVVVDVVDVVVVVSAAVVGTSSEGLAASTDTEPAVAGAFTPRKINAVSSVVTNRVTTIAIRFAMPVHRHFRPDS
jgi:hypothetical protein